MDLLKKVDANWFSEDVNFFYILYEDERMQRVFENHVKSGLDSGKAQFKFVKYIRQRKGGMKSFWSDLEGVDLENYKPGKINDYSKKLIKQVKDKFKKKKSQKTEL